MKRNIAVIIAALSLLSSRADILEYNAPAQSSTGTISTTVDIPKFNTSLGTLTSVYLYAYGAVTGRWTFNSPGGYLTAQGATDYELSVTRPDGGTVSMDGMGFTNEFVDAPSDTIGVVSSNSGFRNLSTPGAIAPYSGTGNVTFVIEGSVTTSYTFTAGLTYVSTATSIDVLCRVSYTYTPASIPAAVKKPKANSANSGH